MSARVSSSRSKGNHAREPMQIGREEPSPSTKVTVSSSSENRVLARDPEDRSKTAKALRWTLYNSDTEPFPRQ